MQSYLNQIQLYEFYTSNNCRLQPYNCSQFQYFVVRSVFVSPSFSHHTNSSVFWVKLIKKNEQVILYSKRGGDEGCNCGLLKMVDSRGKNGVFDMTESNCIRFNTAYLLHSVQVREIPENITDSHLLTSNVSVSYFSLHHFLIICSKF